MLKRKNMNPSTRKYDICYDVFEYFKDRYLRDVHHMTYEEIERYIKEGDRNFKRSDEFDKELMRRSYDFASKVNFDEYIKETENTLPKEEIMFFEKSNKYLIHSRVRVVRRLYEIINRYFFNGCLPSKYAVTILRKDEDKHKGSRWTIDESSENKKNVFLEICVAQYRYEFYNKKQIGLWMLSVMEDIIRMLLLYIDDEEVLPSIPAAIYIICDCKYCGKKTYISTNTLLRCSQCRKTNIHYLSVHMPYCSLSV